MIQKLIILGILKEKPSSGYDIKKYLSEKLGIFSEVETKSIYYPLKKMEKEGLVKKERCKGETNLDKFIYHITPKGRENFVELCKETLKSQQRPFIESDIPLYFINFLEPKEILPFLRLRSIFLERVKKWLLDKKSCMKRFPDNLLLEHHYNLSKAEKDFITNFISSIRRKGTI